MQSKDSRTVSIYALCDPRDDSIRYIGQTAKTPRQRLQEHLDALYRLQRLSVKEKWLYDLVRLGLKPTVRVIEEVAPEDASKREIQVIGDMLANNVALTNTIHNGQAQRAPGGQKRSPEMRIRELPDLTALLAPAPSEPMIPLNGAKKILVELMGQLLTDIVKQPAVLPMGAQALVTLTEQAEELGRLRERLEATERELARQRARRRRWPWSSP